MLVLIIAMSVLVALAVLDSPHESVLLSHGSNNSVGVSL